MVSGAKLTQNIIIVSAVIVIAILALPFLGVPLVVSETSITAGAQLTGTYRYLCGGAGVPDGGDFVCSNSKIDVEYNCPGNKVFSFSQSPGTVNKADWMVFSKTFTVDRDTPTGWCRAKVTLTYDGQSKVMLDKNEFHVTAAPDTCIPIGRTCPDGSGITTAECVNDELVQTGETCKEQCTQRDWRCSAWTECTNGFQTRTCSLTGDCFGDVAEPLKSVKCGIVDDTPPPEEPPELPPDVVDDLDDVEQGGDTSSNTGQGEQKRTGFDITQFTLPIVLVIAVFIIMASIFVFFIVGKSKRRK